MKYTKSGTLPRPLCEPLSASAREALATEAKEPMWEILATDAQEVIDSISAIVFPLKIPATLVSPLPDITIEYVEWQPYTQGDSLAAKPLCNITDIIPEARNLLACVQYSTGQG